MVCVHNALQGGRVVQEGEDRFTEMCNDGKKLQLLWLQLKFIFDNRFRGCWKIKRAVGVLG